MSLNAEDGEMEQKPLISIIIPVYNVEKYLDRCLQSVLRQTYKNIEIILIDDGSSDSSVTICDKYAIEYANVTCVHKKNGGQSSARNEGLRHAKGDYVGFIDSDDWIAEDMYEYLLSLCKKNNCDVAEIVYKLSYSENEILTQPKEKVRVLNNKEALQYFMYVGTKTGSYSACRCLFKRNLLEGLFFREGKINEDLDFKYKALERCHGLAVSNQYKYHYFKSTGSTTTSGLRKKDFQLYEAADILAQLTSKQSYGTIAKLGLVKKARTAFSLLSKIAYYGYSDEIKNAKEVEEKLVAEHRKNAAILLFSPMPMSRKILTIMFAINFEYAQKFIRLVKGFVRR